VKYPARIFFFLALLAVGLSTYRDYGISWDEPFSRQYGAVTLGYVAEQFAPSLLTRAPSDLPSLYTYGDRDHGVLFDAPAVALEVMLGIGDVKNVYLFRHLLTFLVALAGIYAVQRMADRRFLDWRIGLLAALFLVLTPRLFAESFYNSKDIVFMAIFAIAMNTAIRFVLCPSVKNALLHGLASAAAIDVRIMGVILPLTTVTVLIVRFLKRELPVLTFCRALVAYLSAACILVIAMWPWLWSDPIGNFFQALTNMQSARYYSGVRYLGHVVQSTDLPWHYVLVWISITTPILYLGLFLVGAFGTLRQVVSRGIGLWASDEELQDILFFGLFAAPVAAVILLRPVLFDGWRHLYFIYPAFLLLAIRGWVSLWGNESAWTIRKSILTVFTAMSMVHTVAWMWKAHPFQNVYFNALAGTDLRSRYDLDYWGLANRKALEFILKHDPGEEIDVYADSLMGSCGVTMNMIDAQDRIRLRCPVDRNLARYVITNYRLVKDPDDAKYATDFGLFYQIRVDDEPILSVYRRQVARSNSGVLH
jgi:hypothetical protein